MNPGAIPDSEREKILELCDRIESGLEKLPEFRDAIDKLRLSLEIAAQAIAEAKAEINKMVVKDE